MTDNSDGIDEDGNHFPWFYKCTSCYEEFHAPWDGDEMTDHTAKHGGVARLVRVRYDEEGS